MMGALAQAFLLAAYLAPVGLAGGSLWHHHHPWDLTPPRTLSAEIDRIVIHKGARTMAVYRDGEIQKRYYDVALGFAPVGHKQKQGDGKTPEGTFRIDRRNDQSRFHLSLGIDFPKPEDRVQAQLRGLDPGGDIFIHGQPNSVPDHMKIPGDWTDSCVAITNPEIEELFRYTPIGTPVEILP